MPDLLTVEAQCRAVFWVDRASKNPSHEPACRANRRQRSRSQLLVSFSFIWFLRLGSGEPDSVLLEEAAAGAVHGSHIDRLSKELHEWRGLALAANSWSRRQRVAHAPLHLSVGGAIAEADAGTQRKSFVWDSPIVYEFSTLVIAEWSLCLTRLFSTLSLHCPVTNESQSGTGFEQQPSNR